jgi:histidinol-phosphatase (PHP family)
MTHLGFSDHLPYMFPDGYESFYRVDMAAGDEYVKTIKSLAEKYKNKIEIRVGFEMECYPAHFDKMLENARKFGAEYLILGHHFLGNEHPDGIGTRSPIRDSELLREYVDSIIHGIESGVFTYVAHPDIILFVGDEKLYREEMTRLCLKAVEYDIPLEINLHGIRYNRHYPNEVFWKIAGETKAPVTFGVDAHDPEAILIKETVEIANSLVKRFNLNYIGKPKIVDIK